MSETVKLELSHATASLYHARGRHLAAEGKTENAPTSVKYYLAAFRALQELNQDKNRFVGLTDLEINK